MTVLVLGGAGYIGSHTARALRRSGYDVILYDNLSTGSQQLTQGFELVEGDIGDAAKLRSVLARTDAVMHFAAHAYVGESVENPRKYFQNNVDAGLSLLNSVLDAGIRNFIFSSSCAVYGIPQRLPITEEMAREPVNPYGASKLFFEHALEAYGRAYGLRSVRLRYFNAAGADDFSDGTAEAIGELHDPETHLIPLALAACRQDGPELRVFGSDYPTPDGTCIRDYIHVNDLADAHVRALRYLDREGAHAKGAEENSNSLALNLGTGHGYSVLDLIQAVERITGSSVRRSFGPRRLGDPPILLADPAKAQRVLGWIARSDLSDMVSSAWSWMQKNSRAFVSAA
jgi:UDP-glucose-4-epimerase GalE